MKVLLTGGGTAGHVFPLVAIAREMRRIHPETDLKIYYLGPKDDFRKYIEDEGVEIKTIFAGKLRRYITFESVILNIVDIFVKIPLGFLQSFVWIFFLAPDVVISKGGYGSVPVVASGWLLGARIFLHESDVVPGLANKIASRMAVEIFVSFPKTEYFPQSKTICVGNPIRKEIVGGSKEKAKETFNLTGEKPLILICGGSQGARSINELVLLTLPKMLQTFEVVHQCGQKNYQEVINEAKVVIPQGLEKYYHPVDFVKEEELKHLYAAADIIVSRAGSSNIFEIAAVGKPSILIPLDSSAQEHQVKNAYAYAATEAAIIFEETEGFSPHFFLERLRYLISRPIYLGVMAQRARYFSRPQAAAVIASYILAYITL